MDPRESSQWRVNSSFSPPLSRRWDCRDQSDGLSQETPAVPLYGSSLSSHSKGSRSVTSGDQYANHQHSVSDGALSYFESPSNNFQVSRWTPPVQRFDLGEFSTPNGGARIDSSVSPQSSERQFTARVSSTSHSLFSPSPLAESSRWASSGKHSAFPPSRNFPGRRSFMSTPVYPLVFRDPVFDGESGGIPGGASSSQTLFSGDQSPWLESSGSAFNRDLKLPKSPSDTDIDIIENHVNAENRRSLNSSARHQKCGLCRRPLWQKSPWTSHRIVRISDLPIAGVLSCGHVFHADCLEETTPKSLLHEPPCPLCLNLVSHEGSPYLSEPLQLAGRTPRRSRGVDGATDSSLAGSSSNHRNNVPTMRRNLSQPLRRSSSISSRLRKRLSFKVNINKEIFGGKMFRKI